MKKFFIFVLAAAIALLTFAGCSERSKELIIELEGNPTTGYTWTYELDNEDVIKEVSSEFIQYEAYYEETGGAGKFVFTFEGVSKGTVNIDFVYARSWEDTVPEKEIIYTVTVDKNGNIKNYESKKL